MSVSKQQIKFANRIAKIAGIEAKKLGLKARRFSGAYIDDSYIFELEFDETLSITSHTKGNA